MNDSPLSMNNECHVCHESIRKCHCTPAELGFEPTVEEWERTTKLLIKCINDICDEKTVNEIRKKHYELIHKEF